MDISKQYDKACEAVERGNEDYAIQLFRDILSICPDHSDSRRMLRDAVKRRLRKSGINKAGFSVYLKGFMPFVKMNLLGLMGKHDQAIAESEKFLLMDPDSTVALATLGRAAMNVPNGTNTAIWAFESILEVKPNDTKALATLGSLYESSDQVEKATECYERVVRIRPQDRSFESKLRDLAARKTIEAGWDTVSERGDFKKVVKKTEQMDGRSGEEETIRTEDDIDRNIRRVKADIEKEPGNKKYIIQLGDLYRRGKHYDEAEAEYRRAKELDPNDLSIDERLGDLRIEVYDIRIGDMKEAIRKGAAAPGTEQKIVAIIAQRNKFATDEYKERIRSRPTDLELRYKLAILLYGAGEIDAAHAEFQQAAKLPQRRKSSLTHCGMCLFKKGMFDMSVQMYEEALQGSLTIDRDEKNILYNLGLAAEKLGDLKKAEEAYKKIFNIDINFRDVREKIEGLYKRRATR